MTLDYLDLNLPFSHVTFQHHKLNPHGLPGDSTVLYLITEEPLKKALYPWTYYQDLEMESLARLRQKQAEASKDDSDEDE